MTVAIHRSFLCLTKGLLLLLEVDMDTVLPLRNDWLVTFGTNSEATKLFICISAHDIGLNKRLSKTW
jgi:hypothetical protein